MNKVYLLLRDNRESGPYTIDELIQQQLKTSDLIWQEGKSVAWCYPYEIDELKPHVAQKPRLQVVPPSNPSMDPMRQDNRQREQVFSAPSVAASYQPDEIESKADQIRNNIISFAQQNRMPYMSTGNTEPSSGAVWSGSQGFQFVHHSRKKYVTLPQLIATGLVTVLLASAWYGDWSTIRVKPNVVTVASAPAAFNEVKPQQPVQAAVPVLTDSQALVQAEPAFPEGNINAASVPAQRMPETQNLPVSDSDMVKESTATAPVNTAVSALSNTDTNAAETEPKKEPAPVEIKELKKEPVAVVKPTNQESGSEETEVKEEKKKKLGQVIKGIFKKKDKEGE